MKTTHQYFVYLLASKINGILYIGMTNDLQRRIFEHKSKSTKTFTSKYRIHKLVYFETYQNVNEAISREKNLKKWKRDWKINLIQKNNPYWKDLSFDWYREVL